ncbi:hypothetical protein H5410_035728 [Solanum commersonii]|uniref:Reverse transcriptase zinc-binding domain-containing protein n=1 Tax=Solanum commersonii TaxID=4109 RepID=A0A9J5Y4J2_SOLCO|nr:hypothetical protein H5410_035728 [Solanum commersonii]
MTRLKRFRIEVGEAPIPVKFNKSARMIYASPIVKVSARESSRLLAFYLASPRKIYALKEEIEGVWGMTQYDRATLLARNKADGLYSVKAGYSTLCAQNEMVESWSWKLIWKTKLQPKVICFSWKAPYEACFD